MTRLFDAILQGNTAYAGGQTTPMTDLQYGGQNGLVPNLAEWVSQTHYVRRNLVALLIEAPTGFNLLPNPPFWFRALKAMIEVHSLTIDGLNSGLSVTYEETAVSGAGEVMEDFNNVTRARSNPVHTYSDMYGRPIQNFCLDWITYLMADPDSKIPLVSTLANGGPTDLLGDFYSATVLYFEPDPTHNRVAKAWLSTNMTPKLTGDILGKRDLSSPGEKLDLSIEFTALTQTGTGVLAFAQALFDRINIQNANPYLRPPLVGAIDASIEAVGRGYKGNAETLGSQAILRN